ncbi:lipid-binding SYLF domain-containing protein [Kiloniella laminariae]|uniref:lipid-binding SYLF domain-containing protein n=1 Tax=Kiloniella laminariae TaxID=454162 RepID=UPI000378C945|nr:lipid-binding SYLF domain-containing protein [Kiloniella laminariae]
MTMSLTRAFLPASFLRLAIITTAFATLLSFNTAKAASDAEQLVAASRYSLEKLLNNPDYAKLKEFAGKAHGILIIPQLVKAGFFVGGEGGSGVLLVKGADGTWSYPAFYTLAAGSIGLQIGGEVSEVVFTLMNPGAVEAILDSEVKFGGDLSLAVGPFGAGVEASTTANLDVDVYAFSSSVGLFGGGAFEGAKLFTRESYNSSYYGAGAAPRGITMERVYSNTHADKLRAALPQ